MCSRNQLPSLVHNEKIASVYQASDNSEIWGSE
jgi:hypothetical protein